MRESRGVQRSEMAAGRQAMRKPSVVAGIVIVVGAMALAPAAAASDEAGGLGEFVASLARMVLGEGEAAGESPSVAAKIAVPQVKVKEGPLDLGRLAATEEQTDCSSVLPFVSGQSCNSFRCVGGENDGGFCRGDFGFPDGPDADCPGGFCRIPPGQLRANPIP